MQRRIFFSNNGTLEDMSVELGNYFSGTKSFSCVAAEDSIFLGSQLPFNHIYLKFSGTNVNANASELSVAVWDSGDWRSCVEVIDETASSGKTFAQSGFIRWTPDKSYSWSRESTNYSGESITGLTTVEIYDLYWIKLTFSTDLTANVTLSWAGQIFSNDDDLGSEYPDLVRSSVISAFETGKTTWEEQHIRAADIMIKDLIRQQSIKYREQILEREDLVLASVAKTAQIIYGAFGPDYDEQRKAAGEEYKYRISTAYPKIDRNRNAREDIGEPVCMGKAVR